MDEKKNEIEEKNDIEKEIEELNKSMGGSLTEDDKNNIRKILKYIGFEKKRSKLSIFLINARNYISTYLIYILVYFAMFGMLNNNISFSYNWQILLFIVVLSLYQVIIKELLKAYIKPGFIKISSIFIFLGLSIFIVHEFLDLTKLVIFDNWFFLVLYYFGAEVIIFLVRYYISKHIVENILK